MTTAVAAASPSAGPSSPAAVRLSTSAMGGRLVLRAVPRPGHGPEAAADLEIVARRVRAWAAILTRHAPDSPLMRLNRDPRERVPVGPTLAAALRWATDAMAATGGVVDAGLLDERLAAEGAVADHPASHPAGRPADHPHGARVDGRTMPTSGRHPLDARVPLPVWSVRADLPHGAATVSRARGARLDLDGIGKGWIADRALGLLARHAGAIVDADGDIAIRPAPGERVDVGVGDPRSAGGQLAVLSLASGPGRRTWGVATSGTSVHRWSTPSGETHHLIDPRTRRPAATDVVQATVVAGSAREAEALAKAAVILGPVDGLDLVDRSGARGAILLLHDGRVVALPRTMELMA